MLNHGFPDYRKVNVYTFIDKVLCRNKEALKDLYKIEDKSVGLIVLLYNNARKKLLETIKKGTSLRSEFLTNLKF